MRRIALVTGGTRGIGLGIARALARDGFDLVVCGLREEAEVAPALAELRSGGAAAHYLRADVGERADRLRLVSEVRERLGRLHLLVNNAGVGPRVRADLLEAEEASFERLLRVNLQGPYFLTQSVARWMLEQKQADGAWSGAVVFVTSVSATMASTSRGEYCVSKAGLAMASQLWAARLAEAGIPVYEVRPGIIRTDMTAGVTEKYDRLIAQGVVPQGRWGVPDDVGRVVAALARGDAPYSTGAVVLVDGGLTIPRL
ncbi:MAG TPA: 3-ketoacyl-ACP reductase [Vicinamibacteria bacterium]|nr:3-ketoacyl-ACP reductase [Vicinamibacteria bacterium]